jgi:hypothetical protein
MQTVCIASLGLSARPTGNDLVIQQLCKKVSIKSFNAKMEPGGKWLHDVGNIFDYLNIYRYKGNRE